MSNDMVHSPEHYQRGGMECKQVQKAMLEGMLVPAYVAHCWATVLKYIWRWPAKGGVQDLEKAREYLDETIAEAKAAGMR